MKSTKAKYCVGQMIHHKLFDYYGLILSVDQEFCLSEDWYQTMARSSPPKNKPWYHVQVHGGGGLRYVSESNLETDLSVLN